MLPIVPSPELILPRDGDPEDVKINDYVFKVNAAEQLFLPDVSERTYVIFSVVYEKERKRYRNYLILVQKM